MAARAEDVGTTEVEDLNAALAQKFEQLIEAINTGNLADFIHLMKQNPALAKLATEDGDTSLHVVAAAIVQCSGPDNPLISRLGDFLLMGVMLTRSGANFTAETKEGSSPKNILEEAEKIFGKGSTSGLQRLFALEQEFHTAIQALKDLQIEQKIAAYRQKADTRQDVLGWLQDEQKVISQFLTQYAATIDQLRTVDDLTDAIKEAKAILERVNQYLRTDIAVIALRQGFQAANQTVLEADLALNAKNIQARAHEIQAALAKEDITREIRGELLAYNIALVALLDRFPNQQSKHTFAEVERLLEDVKAFLVETENYLASLDALTETEKKEMALAQSQTTAGIPADAGAVGPAAPQSQALPLKMQTGASVLNDLEQAELGSFLQLVKTGDMQAIQVTLTKFPSLARNCLERSQVGRINAITVAAVATTAETLGKQIPIILILIRHGADPSISVSAEFATPLNLLIAGLKSSGYDAPTCAQFYKLFLNESKLYGLVQQLKSNLDLFPPILAQETVEEADKIKLLEYQKQVSPLLANYQANIFTQERTRSETEAIVITAEKMLIQLEHDLAQIREAQQRLLGAAAGAGQHALTVSLGAMRLSAPPLPIAAAAPLAATGSLAVVKPGQKLPEKPPL